MIRYRDEMLRMQEARRQETLRRREAAQSANLDGRPTTMLGNERDPLLSRLRAEHGMEGRADIWNDK